MRNETAVARCENEGCGRAAAAGEPFCEACRLEWDLFRRDTRPDARNGLTGGSPDFSPDAAAALSGDGIGTARLQTRLR
jgi:hypothetical protein